MGKEMDNVVEGGGRLSTKRLKQNRNTPSHGRDGEARESPVGEEDGSYRAHMGDACLNGQRCRYVSGSYLGLSFPTNSIKG